MSYNIEPMVLFKGAYQFGKQCKKIKEKSSSFDRYKENVTRAFNRIPFKLSISILEKAIQKWDGR